MIFILRGFVIIMNMIKHAAELEAVYTRTRGWRQRPANRNAVYFIIIHLKWQCLLDPLRRPSNYQ